MERVLAGYKPEKLYWYFEELTRIPRGSGNEKEVSDFVCDEAKKLGLWYKQDGLYNVIVRKSGCGGLENAEPVILTGHLDVVCEKNNDVVHDFTKDPVDIYVDGDWLKTRGTTLGADNGTAVAIMLALLSETGGKHPPLECLFTTQEETGMAGAQGFDYSLLQGHTLMNLDSGRTLNPTVSCAGAEFDYVTFSFDRSPAPGTALTVSLTGLEGGHSGTRIHLGRKNSILLLARILGMARETVPFRLSGFVGGSKPNAIPREATATLVTEDPEGLKAQIDKITKDIRAELIEDDYGLAVTVTAGGRTKRVLRRQHKRSALLPEYRHQRCLQPDAGGPESGGILQQYRRN
ncbi:MAG: M20/M25/M40 family metallo-hydrolase [Clostridia bacterium]|nr:M20/M25/M40 family metallo-hydrolase [Clostridia bacterium]